MKNVFYNCLFQDKRFPEINDKIIYSYLVYKSLACVDGAFQSGDSEFDFYTVKDFLEFNNFIEIKHITPYKMSKDLNMSINAIKSRLKTLVRIGAINMDKDWLYVGYIKQIKTSKYFELASNTDLKGEKLVIYSYLKHKSFATNGIIHTYDKVQTEELGLSKKHYQKILCELYKDYYIERLESGKLKIN